MHQEKKPKKVTDIKNIIIVILLIALFVVLGLYIFNSNNHKFEIKKLEDDNIKIEKEKKLIDQKYNIILKSIKEDSLKIVSLNQKLILLDNLLVKKDRELNNIRKELTTIKSRINETKNNIEELRKNPIKRNGGELLKSLKEKTDL